MTDHDRGSVLMVGSDAGVRAVADALQTAGFRVRSVHSVDLVAESLHRVEPDVVLVAPSATDDVSAWASIAAHDRLRDVPFVALDGGNRRAEEPAAPWLDRLEPTLDPAQLAARLRLAAEVGRLRRALRSSDALHRGLVSMLLHDLRTPLSSLTLNLELVEMASGLAEEEREDVAQARSSVRALGELMATVQAIGRLEAGEATLASEPHDLASLVKQALERLPPPVAAHPVALDAEPAVRVRCDAEATRRLVAELVTGAVGVTSAESPVRVRVRRSAAAGRLEVTDEGLRIPADLRDLLLTRAGIVEVRRSRRAHSRGFGPLYCRLAAEAQGGGCGIEVEDHVPGDRGNTFWVELPAA